MLNYVNKKIDSHYFSYVFKQLCNNEFLPCTTATVRRRLLPKGRRRSHKWWRRSLHAKRRRRSLHAKGRRRSHEWRRLIVSHKWWRRSLNSEWRRRSHKTSSALLHVIAVAELLTKWGLLEIVEAASKLLTIVASKVV